MTRKSWIWFGAVTAAALLSAATTLLTVATQKVGGTVTCPTGMSVAGVYVHSGGLGKDGFARWQVDDPSTPNVASFTSWVSLPLVYGWTADIGCGQNPADGREWLTNNSSSPVHDTFARFDCTGIPLPTGTATAYGGKCTVS